MPEKNPVSSTLRLMSLFDPAFSLIRLVLDIGNQLG
jgi:hypothetical protein